MAIEDYTTFTEVDPGGQLVVTASKIQINSLPRSVNSWVVSDRGAGFFGGDYTIEFDTQIDAPVNNDGFAQVFMVANDVDDAQWIHENSDANGVRIVRAAGIDIAVQLTEADGGTEYLDTYTGTTATTYYLKVVRDEGMGVNGTLSAFIYSDASRTVLLDTLSIALHSSKKDYQQLYGAASWKAPSGGEVISGFVQNLELIAVVSNGLSGELVKRFTTRPVARSVAKDLWIDREV